MPNKQAARGMGDSTSGEWNDTKRCNGHYNGIDSRQNCRNNLHGGNHSLDAVRHINAKLFKTSSYLTQAARESVNGI